MTQEAAAERAKMSTYTWIKIEKGEVSVSMSSWLSALECIDLLHALNLQANDVQQRPLLNAAVRQRAHSRTANIDFDF